MSRIWRLTNRAKECMMQCNINTMGRVCNSNSHILVAELWLKIVGCKQVGLPATRIKQQLQAIESKGADQLLLPAVLSKEYLEFMVGLFFRSRTVVVTNEMVCEGLAGLRNRYNVQ